MTATKSCARRLCVAVVCLAAAVAAQAADAELLANGSLDAKSFDGKTPADWRIPGDVAFEYRERDYLSEDFLVAVRRDTPGVLLSQKLKSSPGSGARIDFRCDRAFVGDRVDLDWKIEDGEFRIFVSKPVNVTLNNLSLRVMDDVELNLGLKRRERKPSASGRFPERKLHVFAKEKVSQRVLLFASGSCLDWVAEDLERQFGLKVDVVNDGATADPETVQRRFSNGEYVLLFAGTNADAFEKKEKAVVSYVRRGGRAVFVSSEYGRRFGRPRELPQGVDYSRISPKGCGRYGIASLTEGRFGDGMVVELLLRGRVFFRSAIWPEVDEVYLTRELSDFDERQAGYPYNEMWSLLYADLILDRELEVVPWTHTPDAPLSVRPCFEDRRKFVVAGYLWMPIHYRRQFYPVMRDIGINAINCWMPGAYDAAKHGFAWTDGWGGIVNRENPIVEAALQEQGVHGRTCYGNDPVKKHWRNGCLSDATWKPAAEAGFAAYARLARGREPFAYAIGDEMTLSAPWMNYHAKDSEPCRMAPCLARFRNAMRTKYGDVAALNRAWGTAFATFDDVVPSLTDEMRGRRRKGDRNYASWLEFRLFMDDVLAEVSKVAVDVFGRENPRISTGQPNWTWMTPMAGIDPSKIVPNRTSGQDYGPSAYVRSFKRKGAPVLTWLGYGNYDNIEMDVWSAVNNGATGIMLYGSVQHTVATGEGYLSEDGLLSANGRRLKAALAPLVSGGWGDLINAAERAPMPVTILYAQGGMGIAWLESDDPLQFDWEARGKKEGSHYLNWFRSQEQWEKALHTLRLGFDYTSEPQLAKRLETAKVLVLPECWALSQTTRNAIRDFRARGGVVVGDDRCGRHDERGVPTASFAGMLDRCCPSLPNVNDASFVDGLRDFLADCGVKADYEIAMMSGGGVATGITCGDFRTADGRRILLLTGRAVDAGNVMKGTRALNAQPDTELELRLPAEASIHDVLSGKTVTAASFRWNPKARPCIVAIREVER